jgi:hypothetical protein
MVDRVVSGELVLSDFLARRRREAMAQPSESDTIDAEPILTK